MGPDLGLRIEAAANPPELQDGQPFEGKFCVSEVSLAVYHMPIILIKSQISLDQLNNSLSRINYLNLLKLVQANCNYRNYQNYKKLSGFLLPNRIYQLLINCEGYAEDQSIRLFCSGVLSC